MNQYWLLAVLPNLVGFLVAAWIAYRVHDGPESSYRRSLLALFAFLALNSLVLGVQRVTTDLNAYLALVVLEYICEVGLVVSMLNFVINYTGHGDWLTRPRRLLVAAPGAAVVVLNATNAWHGLFYERVDLVVEGGISLVHSHYGPLFMLWAGYFATAVIVGIVLLYTSLPLSSRRRKATTCSFILALAIMTIGSIAFILYSNKSPYLDLLSITMTMAALAIFFGERNFNTAEAELVNVREVVRAIEDPIMLVNQNMKVVFTNDQGHRLLEANREVLVQKVESKGLRLPLGNNRWETALDLGGEPRHFSITSSDIVRDGKAIAAVLLYHDITDRKRMEDDIRRSNQSLGTLNQIVRHDIRNDLTAIWGYLELLEATELNERQRYLVGKLLDKARRAEGHLTFAKGRQAIGCHEPVWHDLETTIVQALDLVDTEGVELDIRVGEVKVLADPMLPNVFHALADNSVRHGKGVSRISVQAELDHDGLQIIWEDDGVGVRDEDKSRIFDQGFGANTGEGLYIAREVLMMADATMVEDGTPGRGARFVMHFPSSRYWGSIGV